LKVKGGMVDIALPTVNLNIGWRYVANFTLRPLYPQERTPFPTEEEAAWVPEAVWTLRKIEKSLDNARNRKKNSFVV
jgi:hypothetical protein